MHITSDIWAHFLFLHLITPVFYSGHWSFTLWGCKTAQKRQNCLVKLTTICIPDWNWMDFNKEIGFDASNKSKCQPQPFKTTPVDSLEKLVCCYMNAKWEKVPFRSLWASLIFARLFICMRFPQTAICSTFPTLGPPWSSFVPLRQNAYKRLVFCTLPDHCMC